MDNDYERIIRFISRVLTICLVIAGLGILVVFVSGNIIAGILGIVSTVIVGKYGFMLIHHYDDATLTAVTNQRKLEKQRATIVALKSQIADAKASRMNKHEAQNANRITELQTRIAHMETKLRLAMQKAGVTQEEITE